MKSAYCGGIALFVALFVCVNFVGAQQDQDEANEQRLEERLDEQREIKKTTAQELIEMLKKRALRRIKEERHKQFWAFKGTIGLHAAYDNNVNVDSDRDGDSYVEQYFSYSWVPTFNNHLAAEVGTWYFSDWYSENRDTTIIDNAFNASLKWYPRGDPSFEVQPGYERTFAYYRWSEDSSYLEDTAFLKWKHRFWKRWSQGGEYEYAWKEYDSKKPRTGPGSTSYIIGNVVEKQRQSAEYYVGFPLAKNNCKIKGKIYRETSNDAYIDYYDVYSYKGTLELGRSLTRKLYLKLSSAYERKNYWHRSLTATNNTAQYDDIYTQKLNLYYTVKRGWTLSYTLTYKKADSNYSVYDYDSMSHKAGLYISF